MCQGPGLTSQRCFKALEEDVDGEEADECHYVGRGLGARPVVVIRGWFGVGEEGGEGVRHLDVALLVLIIFSLCYLTCGSRRC